MKEFEYIKSTYKVPAEIGREILFEGKRKGVIVEDKGNYIGVNFYDTKSNIIVPLHPTWEVEYLFRRKGFSIKYLDCSSITKLIQSAKRK